MNTLYRYHHHDHLVVHPNQVRDNHGAIDVPTDMYIISYSYYHTCVRAESVYLSDRWCRGMHQLAHDSHFSDKYDDDGNIVDDIPLNDDNDTRSNDNDVKLMVMLH